MASATERLRNALGIGKSRKPKSIDKTSGNSMKGTDFLQSFMGDWFKKKKTPQDRLRLYKAYDEMDLVMPEIGGFLDTVASEATQINEAHGHRIWVASKKASVRKRIEDLMYRKLKIDDWTPSTCRTLAKYGDDPGEILYDKEGVQGIYWGVPLSQFMRFETMDGQLLGFAVTNNLKDISKEDLLKPEKIKSKISKPWDYVHFRIMTEKRYSAFDPCPVMYGTSLLRRAIRPSHRLDILFDLLLAYRASRAVDRFILKIDVTGQVPEEQYETLMKWKEYLYNLHYENQESGEFSMLGNPLAVGEDILWPVTQNSQSDIDTLQGNPNLYEAFDIDLAINQLYGSLSAPKGMFGYDDRVDMNRPFAAQDIRLAKLIFKLQASFMEGIRWIILVDLALSQNELKLKDEDLVDPELFDLHMVPPSAILYLHRLEALRDILDATRDYLDLRQELSFDEPTSVRWEAHALTDILGSADFNIEEFIEYLEKTAKEMERAAASEGVEAAMVPAQTEQPPEGEGEGEEEGAEEAPPEERLMRSSSKLMVDHQYKRDDLPPQDSEQTHLREGVVYDENMISMEEEDDEQEETD